MNWITLYGRIREAFGYTTTQIDDLDLIELSEIDEHWKAEPPIGVVVRAWVGIGRHVEVEDVDDFVPTPRNKEVTAEEYERMRLMFDAEAKQHGLRSPW